MNIYKMSKKKSLNYLLMEYFHFASFSIRLILSNYARVVKIIFYCVYCSYIIHKMLAMQLTLVN